MDSNTAKDNLSAMGSQYLIGSNLVDRSLYEEPFDFIPSIQSPLVLRKTFKEHGKYWIKELLSLFGISINNWKQQRINYKTNRGKGGEDTWSQPKEYSESDIKKLRQAPDGAWENYKSELSHLKLFDFKETIQFSIFDLLHYLLREKAAKSILEIGCFYAMMGKYLIENFDGIDYTGLDFPDDLCSQNKEFTPLGLKFHPGYPLHWIMSTNIQYDIAMFNRVFCIMNQQEIRRYLRALKTKVKYIVFNEAARITFHPANLNIDNIDKESGFPMPGWLIHNYRYIFEDEGYTFLHYDCIRNSEKFSAQLHFTIRGIAILKERS